MSRRRRDIQAGAATPTPQGAAYIARMLELLDGRDPLTVMRELAPALESLREGLSEAALAQRPAEGGWSVREVVHHLADAELVYGYRLRMTLTLDTPSFELFDQESWGERFRYRSAPLDEALAVLRALRRVHLRHIESIEPQELDRAGLHTGRGREPVRRLLQLWAAHDLAHRRQISRLRKSIGA